MRAVLVLLICAACASAHETVVGSADSVRLPDGVLVLSEGGDLRVAVTIEIRSSTRWIGPLHLDIDGLPSVDVEIRGRNGVLMPVSAVVDTGSDAWMLLAQGVTARIGPWDLHASVQSSTILGESIETSMVAFSEIRIGHVSSAPMVAHVQWDEDKEFASFGRGAIRTWGSIVLDGRGREFWVRLSESISSNEGQAPELFDSLARHSIPMKVEDSGYYVQASLGEMDGCWLLDTGFSGEVALFEDVASRVSLHREGSMYVNSGFGRKKAKSFRANVSLEIASWEWGRPAVVILPRQASVNGACLGVLGYGLFGKRVLWLDSEGGRLAMG